MSRELDKDALAYHRAEPAGKLAIVATKPMATQRDLALAYSPGVAAACNEIVRDPVESYTVTARGNLVGVISNGTAVLGLGAIGALASKPVMEGKAVLFKKFSNIDVFDIEIDERDPQAFIETVARLEPTFGGINLEDIKAPECFIIEKALKERMKIPVFHDDQHGTAIVAGAAVYNALRVVGKDIGEVKLVVSGAGAAALSCTDLLVNMGLKKENIWLTDIAGVVYKGRAEEMDEYKARYAQDTDARTLDDVIGGADLFLGLSAPGVLKPAMVEKMAERPIILAMANPVPEILPDEARAVRPDVIMATGRSDYPNQVNNVLCFPFIFRGALDCGATTINEEMKVACVKALAELAMAEPVDRVQKAYAGEPMRFGPEYLIPKPFDPRLIFVVAPAVAQAAMETGVATRPIADLDAYRASLARYAYRTSEVMGPILEHAKRSPKRVVFAEGESSRVLMAVQQVVDERLAQPILVGDRSRILQRIENLQLRIRDGQDIRIVDPQGGDWYEPYLTDFSARMGRKGISPDEARGIMHSDKTAIAAMMCLRGDADAMLCGAHGRFRVHLATIEGLIDRSEGVGQFSTVTALNLPASTVFICDSHVNPDPSTEEVVQATLLAAEEVRRFGIKPKVALLSSSNFGTNDLPDARKMREARALLAAEAPDLIVDGEMHADSALSEDLRSKVFPDSVLRGQANLLVMPNVEAAHIAYGLLKTLGSGIAIGPILLGASQPVHILSQSSTVRGIFNMTAVAVAGVQSESRG
ncbi:malic enzyme [Marinobacterium nitratireducens]|uniref:NADP-dependent malic enzyme n=1 Tax=Marinobacterium nitratireducens TaxID=518897 RepID=A0A917ZIP4_9GAMM|nr:NADP-dependent malic enzyme [Marinobacterium nitratireducens]GGO83691.1 malic enzyme [Marinobacterium nitratireducens]